MAREKPAYRDNVERIKIMFPDKELLSVFEAARFLGVDSRTVKKYFPIKNGFISVATLARELS